MSMEKGARCLFYTIVCNDMKTFLNEWICCWLVLYTLIRAIFCLLMLVPDLSTKAVDHKKYAIVHVNHVFFVILMSVSLIVASC